MYLPLILDAYIHLLGMQFLISFSDGLMGYTFPLYDTLAVKKPHGFDRAHPALHASLYRASPDWATNCARGGERRPVLLVALSFLLTTNLFDSIFR